jgi:4-hydroxy-4-methyl-2-oxoglutarate aldolase
MSCFDLTTPLIADAALKSNAPLRIAAAGIRSVAPQAKAAGRVRLARHFGSVDVFLEAIIAADSGEVLVIDNGGRSDEACVGDLIALEARAHSLAGHDALHVSRREEDAHLESLKAQI